MSQRPPSLLPEPSTGKHANLDPSLRAKIEEVNARLRCTLRPCGEFTNDQLGSILFMLICAAPPEARMKQFKSVNDCVEWIGHNPSVAEILQGAIRQGNYEEVMFSPLLHMAGQSSCDYWSFHSNRDAVFAAFQIPYVPGFPSALLEALDQYSRRSTYNQTISIVQSSGTGKSRGIEEVARSRFTFLFNLRREVHPNYAYPHPDANVRDFFIHDVYELGDNDSDFQKKYAAFLCSLFTHTHALLSDSDRRGVPVSLWWYNLLNRDATKELPDPKRVSFYDEVIAEAKTFLQQPAESLFRTLHDSCHEFIEYLHTQYTEFHPVACILAFDEAQELIERLRVPAIATRKVTHSLYHNLGSVLGVIGSSSVFSVFLSTNPSISSLAPPVHLRSSLRDLPEFCPPITELPLDVFATNLYSDLKQSGRHTLAATSSVEVMARFGRAMWYSLHACGYDHVTDLAKTKLNPTQNFVEDIAAQIACLGIRIGLDFEPLLRTGQMEAELVRAYMRVLFAASEDLDTLQSGTPSEPVVAEAAARLLNRWHFSDFRQFPLLTLTQAFKKGYLAQEERGQVIGRLLWTLAHDKVLRDAPRWHKEVHFHVPISIIDFLKALFHESHWNVILEARPIGEQDGPPLAEAFKDAYVHFSHFVDGRAYKLPELREVYRLLLRGAALNCGRDDGSINFLTPVLFGPPDSTTIRLSASSVLQAQIRDHPRPREVYLSPTLVNSSNELPVLSLVHQLGTSEHAVECDGPAYVISSTQKKKYVPPHYQIVAYGCSSETYGIIPETANDMYSQLLCPRQHEDDFLLADMSNHMDPAFELEHGENECRWFGEDEE